MAVGLSLVLVAFLLFGGSILSLFGINSMEQDNRNTGGTEEIELPQSGVETKDLQEGTGETAATGDNLTVHYVGVLPSGKVFDSSVDANRPFTFTLGQGDVIRGWDEGLVGMREGGIRRVMIAPDYGYGAQAIGAIPANSHLIFEVQLLEVDKGE